MFEIYFDIGQILLEDDIKDLGRYWYDGHKSMIHHWQWGILLMLGSVMAEAFLMLNDILNSLNMNEMVGDNNGKASTELT